MRTAVKVEGTCDPCPELTQIARPAGGILGDVYVRGNHMGANVWIFTVYASLEDAQGEDNPAGVAGSEFPEDSGQWPVTDNPPYPPTTTGWELHVVLPETAPDPCYVIWHWTVQYAQKVTDSVCAVLRAYTGEGKSLAGVTVQCGEPGAEHVAQLVYVTIGETVPAKSARTYSGRLIPVRMGIRVAKLDGPAGAAAEKAASRLVGALSAIVSEQRAALSAHGGVQFEQVSSGSGGSGYWESEVVFTVTEHLVREG